MSDQPDGEKPFEGSAKRLLDLRAEGRIARSPDLFVAASYGGMLLAIMATGTWMLREAGALLAGVLANAAELSVQFSKGGQAMSPQVALPLAKAIAPVFALPALMVLLMITLQRAWVFTPANLMPKLSRISPVTAAKNKYGLSGLFDFGKNTLKLSAIAIVLGIFLWHRLDEMLGAMALTPVGGAGVLLWILRDFLAVVFAISLLLGGLDYLWQMFRHLKSARMTRQEMTDEHKTSEGDPHIKGQRRQRAQEYAMNRMLQDVPGADVVVVNPTHFAVALKWDRASGRAPVCVAKGADEIAARIRERAQLAGVPIHSDPPTARQLWREVEIGAEIGRSHYRAVAAAIRFATDMRQRAARRR